MTLYNFCSSSLRCSFQVYCFFTLSKIRPPLNTSVHRHLLPVLPEVHFLLNCKLPFVLHLRSNSFISFAKAFARHSLTFPCLNICGPGKHDNSCDDYEQANQLVLGEAHFAPAYPVAECYRCGSKDKHSLKCLGRSLSKQRHNKTYFGRPSSRHTFITPADVLPPGQYLTV